jgi:hypothetical protein
LAAAVLADGTPVKLRVSRGTNTAGLRVGDTAELEVVQDVKVGDITVISTNNVATAVVTAQHARTSTSDSGRVDADLHSVTLVDGETVALRTVRQPSSSSQAVVASSAWQDVVLADGMELTAYVAGNLKLDLTRMQLAASSAGELRISSTPSNAEISIDGRVLGMAPYTAHVNRGEHIVVLRAAGYEPWRRTVSLSSDAVDLRRNLRARTIRRRRPRRKSLLLHWEN